jgi:hypothetical protein
MTHDMRNLLPELRKIGFGTWDPLGLMSAWRDGEAVADEYDRYLLQAYSAALNGADAGSICTYLREAEIQMGLEAAGPDPRREKVADQLLTLSGRAIAR